MSITLGYVVGYSYPQMLDARYLVALIPDTDSITRFPQHAMHVVCCRKNPTRTQSKVAQPGGGGGGRDPIAPAATCAGAAANKFLFFQVDKIINNPTLLCMSDPVITLDPPNLLFPFRPDGHGRALRFSWRKFRWEPLVGNQDNYGYHVAAWTPRDENNEPLPRRFKKVHAIVWEVHNGPVPDGLEIDHIDGDKSNSQISNLRLVTHAQNIQFARERLGNWSPCKLTSEQRAYVISLPSNHNWAKLSRELGVHKVTLLNIRCKAKKEAQRA